MYTWKKKFNESRGYIKCYGLSHNTVTSQFLLTFFIISIDENDAICDHLKAKESIKDYLKQSTNIEFAWNSSIYVFISITDT